MDELPDYAPESFGLMGGGMPAPLVGAEITPSIQTGALPDYTPQKFFSPVDPSGANTANPGKIGPGKVTGVDSSVGLAQAIPAVALSIPTGGLIAGGAPLIEKAGLPLLAKGLGKFGESMVPRTAADWTRWTLGNTGAYLGGEAGQTLTPDHPVIGGLVGGAVGGAVPDLLGGIPNLARSAGLIPKTTAQVERVVGQNIGRNPAFSAATSPVLKGSTPGEASGALTDANAAFNTGLTQNADASRYGQQSMIDAFGPQFPRSSTLEIHDAQGNPTVFNLNSTGQSAGAEAFRMLNEGHQDALQNYYATLSKAGIGKDQFADPAFQQVFQNAASSALGGRPQIAGLSNPRVSGNHTQYVMDILGRLSPLHSGASGPLSLNSFDDVNSLSNELTRAIGEQYGPGGNPALAKGVLEPMQDKLLSAPYEYLQANTPATAPQASLQDARDAYRTVQEVYKGSAGARNVVGNILQTSHGDPTRAFEAMPSILFGNNKTGATNVTDFMQAAAGPNGARADDATALLLRMTRQNLEDAGVVGADGSVDPAKLAKWQGQNSNFLQAAPADVGAAVDRLGQSAATMSHAQQTLGLVTDTMKGVQKVVNPDDPDLTARNFSKLFNTTDPAPLLRFLSDTDRSVAKGEMDQSTADVIRSSLKQQLAQTLVSRFKPMQEGQTGAQPWNQWRDAMKPAFMRLLGPEDFNTIDSLASQQQAVATGKQPGSVASDLFFAQHMNNGTTAGGLGLKGAGLAGLAALTAGGGTHLAIPGGGPTHWGIAAAGGLGAGAANLLRHRASRLNNDQINAVVQQALADPSGYGRQLLTASQSPAGESVFNQILSTLPRSAAIGAATGTEIPQ